MKTEREGTLGRHYNLVRPLVWKCLTQLKAELPQDPAPPLLSTHLNYVSLLAGCDLKGRLPPTPRFLLCSSRWSKQLTSLFAHPQVNRPQTHTLTMKLSLPIKCIVTASLQEMWLNRRASFKQHKPSSEELTVCTCFLSHMESKSKYKVTYMT